MNRCCDKCWHTPEYPCRNFIRCRTEGPLCHDDSRCREKRRRRLYELTYGKKGLLIKVPIASCTIASGALEVYKKVLDVVKSRGIDADIKKVGCMGLCYIDPWIDTYIFSDLLLVYTTVVNKP